MSFKNFLSQLVTFFLDLLFPIKCHSCGENGTWLCSNCFKKIPLLVQDSCPLCYRTSQRGFLCFKCLKRSYIERILLASDFKNPILKETIHIFKYEMIKDLANPLGQLLTNTLKQTKIDSSFILIPIPLHRKRLLFRGFNQAELLAQILGKELNLEVENGVLKRKIFSLPQTELKDPEARKQNIKNAFSLAGTKGSKITIKSLFNFCKLNLKSPVSRKLKSINSVSAKDKIKNKNIILIDDVLTTGATLQEAAKVLKKAGARKIWALALARA